MFEIRESDWLIWQQLRYRAQERFSERCLNEMQAIAANSALTAQERFQRIAQLIPLRKQQLAESFEPNTPENALRHILSTQKQGLLHEEELDEFGVEIQQILASMWNITQASGNM